MRLLKQLSAAHCWHPRGTGSSDEVDLIVQSSWSWTVAGPYGSFVSTGLYSLVTWRYQVRIPVVRLWLCIYSAPNCSKPKGLECAVLHYGTVHYKEPLKSFEVRARRSPGFGLPSIAILPWLCRKRCEAILFTPQLWTVPDCQVVIKYAI